MAEQITKAELKAAGERLVTEYNKRVNEIDQQLRLQADLKLLGESAILADTGEDGLAKAQKQLAALQKEIASEAAVLAGRKVTISQGTAEIKDLAAAKRTLQAEVKALQSELDAGRKFLAEVDRKKKAYAAL
jgi:hypothetical protein